MARIELLMQAFEGGSHADALRKMLSMPELERFVASVAFVREEGVNAIAEELQANAKVCSFFVGIRNDITSIQAVRRLLDLNVTVIAVDTASRSTLFHPKMYLALNGSAAMAVVGSANVTFSGLHNNIEASTILHLDPADFDDAKFFKESLSSLDSLPVRFPDHVFQVKTKETAEKLFQQGRLSDEAIVTKTPPRASVQRGERDDLSPIGLPRKTVPKRKGEDSVKRNETVRKGGAKKTTKKAEEHTAVVQRADFVLVWESKPLSERDLNIPSGKTTHATGSMLWKKGLAEDIDQRHYFRDEIFSGIKWKKDSKKSNYEVAEADFVMVIKGLNYGMHRLILKHKTDKESKTYIQRNGMTSIRWGKVSGFVKKRDLLGRTMSLYRNAESPPKFLLEID